MPSCTANQSAPNLPPCTKRPGQPACRPLSPAACLHPQRSHDNGHLARRPGRPACRPLSPAASPHPQRSHGNGHLIRRARSLRGLGQRPSGEVQEAGGGLLAQSARARSPRSHIILRTSVSHTPQTQNSPKNHTPKIPPPPFTKHAIILSQHPTIAGVARQQETENPPPAGKLKVGLL